MAIPVKALTVVIGGSARGLQLAARTAVGSLGLLAKAAKAALGAVKNIFLFGAIPAGVGLGFLLTDAIRKLDQLRDKASAVGIEPNFLEALANIGAEGGASLDKVGDAVERVVELFQEFVRAGTGEGAFLFEQIFSPSQRANLALKSTADQFLAIAKAIGSLETEAQQLEATTKIAGGDIEILNLFRTLAEEPRRLQRELRSNRQAGLFFSPKEGEQVSDLVEQARELGRLISGIARRFAIQIAPNVGRLLDKLNELGRSSAFATKMQEFADAFGDFLDGINGESAQRFLEYLRQVRAELDAIVFGVNRVTGVFSGVVGTHRTTGLAQGIPAAANEALKSAFGVNQAGALPAGAVTDAIEEQTDELIRGFKDILIMLTKPRGGILGAVFQ